MKSVTQFPDIFGLKVYGDMTRSKLYTSKVHGYMAVFNIILLLQYVLDWWAWSRTWNFGIGQQTGGWLIAIVIGAIFAGAILLFDRAIITGDTHNSGEVGSWWKRNSGYLFRFGMIMFLALLTSVAVELSVFEPDINREINQAERSAIDKVRGDAIALETKRFDELARLTAGEHTASTSKDVALAQQAIDEYTKRRNASREQILKDQAGKRIEHQQLLKTAADKAVSEAAGKYSHRVGIGPLTMEARRQEADASKRLKEFETEAREELVSFDADTEAEVKRLTEVRDGRNAIGNGELTTAMATQLAKKQDKIREIEGMNGPALTAAGYAGDWEQSRGFMARYHVLQDLTRKPFSANWWIMWGCRALMIVFGLLVLGLKIFAPEEFRIYYSLGHQARAGQRDACEAVEAMGLDPDTYGLDGYVRRELEMLMEKWAELAQQVIELSENTLDWAKPNRHGRSPTYEQLLAMRQMFWIKSGAKLQVGVVTLEDKLRHQGIMIPKWPTDLVSGKDARSTENPWYISKAELADGFGWENPEPKIARADQLMSEIVDAYNELRKLVSEGEQQLQDLIYAMPTEEVLYYSRTMSTYYRKQIEPLIIKTANLERKLEELGGRLPEWPRDYPDPRGDMRERFMQFDAMKLKRLGWQDPDKVEVEEDSTPIAPVPTGSRTETVSTAPPPPPHLVRK